MACRRRINGATRSGLRLVMQRLIPKPSLGLFLAARGTFRDNQQFRRVLPRGNTPTQLPAVISEYVMSNCPFRSAAAHDKSARRGRDAGGCGGRGAKKAKFCGVKVATAIRASGRRLSFGGSNANRCRLGLPVQTALQPRHSQIKPRTSDTKVHPRAQQDDYVQPGTDGYLVLQSFPSISQFPAPA
jgi:hypothetical protein